MPQISGFGLQYSNVHFSAILHSPYDLIIAEGDPLPPPGSAPAISDAQVIQLQAQSRTLVGYVDISVTEEYCGYWDPSWTDDGTDHGNLTANAPSWLQGQPHSTATTVCSSTMWAAISIVAAAQSSPTA